MSPEDRFFGCLTGEPYPLEEWEAIARHMIQGLEEFLSQSIKVSEMNYYCTEGKPGFNCDIESAQPLGAIMQLSWFGFFHTAAYGPSREGGPNQPFIAAWLFCRSMGSRLLTSDGLAYVYITYETTAGGGPEWINHGWKEDEWGEFEHWK